ncbi:MAG: RCC1 domain-containing protein [Actinobacteria bacterium]|nr:RCC1 domain-containing protein [Actinomycetota bacterium]
MRRPPSIARLLVALLLAALALPTDLQAAPAVRAPVVTGTVHVGGTLTAKVATPAAKGTTYVFQWQAQKKVTVKKKTVSRWVAVPGAGKAVFMPPAALKGASVRACVKAKGAKSAWKCSGAKIVAAAPTPATPTPATPNPLSVSFLTQRFITGSAGTVLSPTTTGGSGTTQFSVSGTLPTGVAFDQATGTFTGPAASAWNFRATQIAPGGAHTCALTTSGGVKCWGRGNYGRLVNGAAPNDQLTPVDITRSGEQPGFPAVLSVTVTDDTGSWTLGRVVLGTK